MQVKESVLPHRSVFRHSFPVQAHGLYLLIRSRFMDVYTINPSLEYLLVSRNLERVADLATNIGEDAVFLAEGKNIKHGGGLEY